MSELHFYKKGKAVRLTDQAHAILAEWSDKHNITQKEIASEATLLMLVKREEDRDNIAQTCTVSAQWLDKKLRDSKRYAFGTFALGAIAGGVLMFFIGMVI